MAAGQPFRSFRDPVHRFVGVNRLEAALVDTPPFQRLRHIRQLALTCYVYPDAEHRRFSHSLGVMGFGSRIFDTLVDKGLAECVGWGKEETARQRQLLRLACLLHDLGHPPFSHAGEQASRPLLPSGWKHEEYTYRLVNSEHIASVLADGGLNEYGITPDEVVAVLRGTQPSILTDIVAGDIDADKMDYLRRDSLHAGVDYGVFDHERLIESLTFRADYETQDKPVLAIEEGGIHAAEAMVLARYWMFTQVYFHDVRRAYDRHLADFVSDLLLEVSRSDRYPEDLEEYLKWNDVTVLAELQRRAGTEKADRLLHRRHWRVCGQTTAVPDQDELVDFGRRADAAAREVRLAFVDWATDHRLALARSTTFHVLREGGNRFQPIAHVSPLIRGITPIAQGRLYAAPEVTEQAAQLMGPFAVAREEAP